MIRVLRRRAARFVPWVPGPLVCRAGARYVAGPNLSDAINVAKRLRREGTGVTLDVLGESATEMSAARKTADTYADTIKALQVAGFSPNVSIKLSAFGFDVDPVECEVLVARSADAVTKANGFMRLDMEWARTVDATLDMHDRFAAKGFKVGVVLQAKLIRTNEDAARLAIAGAAVRLVKGVYLESSAIAHRDSALIRKAYLDALELLLDGTGRVAIATHDSFLIDRAIAMVKRMHVSTNRYEFQMLYGVLPELRPRIVANGHPVRVYLPYGPDSFSYCCRRLCENLRSPVK